LEDFFWERFKVVEDGTTFDGNYTEVFYFEGKNPKPRNEACGIADWIMINLRLWEIYGDEEYLEAAEISLTNALCATQFPNYGFGHRWYLGGFDYVGYVTEGEEAWWCCSYHGPFAFLDFKKYLYTSQNDELWINFLLAGKLKSGDLSLTINSNYPAKNVVTIDVDCIKPVEKTLAIRIPSFLDPAELLAFHNGREVPGKIEKGRLKLTGIWQQQDQVRLELPMKLELIDNTTGEPVKAAAGKSGLPDCSIRYGSLFLGFAPPHEIALDDQVLSIPMEHIDSDGVLTLPKYSWIDDGLDSGAAHTPGANIYGLFNEGLHFTVTVKSKDGQTQRGRDLYPENEATRRYCSFRVRFPVVIENQGCQADSESKGSEMG
jgi:hypothetical protein